MKKIFLIPLIFIFIFSGCSGTEKVKIENNDWTFSRISDDETDKIIFCSEENKLKFNEAEVSALSLSADKSSITITNSVTEEHWTLEYTENKTANTNNADGLIYDVFYKNDAEYLKGYATTGSASKNDIYNDNYLIITIGGYSLYFIDTAE